MAKLRYVVRNKEDIKFSISHVIKMLQYIRSEYGDLDLAERVTAEVDKETNEVRFILGGENA